MPERKEIHYFCDDLNFPKRSAIRDWAEYLALFIDATDDMRIGDTSASYLYSDVAVHNNYEDESRMPSLLPFYAIQSIWPILSIPSSFPI